MYSNEHTLQQLLKQAYHRLDMDDTAREMEVVQVYGVVVGDFIKRLTQRVSFSQGVLTVQLASAALKQELAYRRSSLAETINEALGYVAVKKIVIM
ncbi:MAG: DUF721 domain-containing protein [Bacteroidales bacterium]|nr:DUF721 domain-containing protein [Bacteroidales bacterium]